MEGIMLRAAWGWGFWGSRQQERCGANGSVDGSGGPTLAALLNRWPGSQVCYFL